MPNTLGHLCVQGLATRAIVRGADLKWICLGCVIPDVPWILQRLVRPLVPDAALLDLRLHAIVQSSLLFSLLLCGALALAAAEPGRVLRILSLNALLHLLLDACQTKWANGVHLFAPFSWRLTNFGLFWPESPVTAVLTVSGLVYLLYCWRRSPGIPVALSVRGARRAALAAGLFVAYFALPFALLAGPESADNHSVQTLRSRAERAGRDVAFDRPAYLRKGEEDFLRIFTREELTIRNGAQSPGVVSVRGRFVDEKTIDVVEAHRHASRLRDLASLIGLSLVALLWTEGLLPRHGGSTGQI